MDVKDRPYTRWLYTQSMGRNEKNSETDRESADSLCSFFSSFFSPCPLLFPLRSFCVFHFLLHQEIKSFNKLEWKETSRGCRSFFSGDEFFVFCSVQRDRLVRRCKQREISSNKNSILSPVLFFRLKYCFILVHFLLQKQEAISKVSFRWELKIASSD